MIILFWTGYVFVSVGSHCVCFCKPWVPTCCRDESGWKPPSLKSTSSSLAECMWCAVTCRNTFHIKIYLYAVQRAIIYTVSHKTQLVGHLKDRVQLMHLRKENQSLNVLCIWCTELTKSTAFLLFVSASCPEVKASQFSLSSAGSSVPSPSHKHVKYLKTLRVFINQLCFSSSSFFFPTNKTDHNAWWLIPNLLYQLVEVECHNAELSWSS